MADRNLVKYEEERNPEGPYWSLEIDRSSAGQPGLLFSIKHQMFGKEEVAEQTVFVKDGNALLAPVLKWLKDGAVSETEQSEAVDRAIEIGGEIVNINSAISELRIAEGNQGRRATYTSILFVTLSEAREVLRSELLAINDQISTITKE